MRRPIPKPHVTQRLLRASGVRNRLFPPAKLASWAANPRPPYAGLPSKLVLKKIDVVREDLNGRPVYHVSPRHIARRRTDRSSALPARRRIRAGSAAPFPLARHRAGWPTCAPHDHGADLPDRPRAHLPRGVSVPAAGLPPHPGNPGSEFGCLHGGFSGWRHGIRDVSCSARRRVAATERRAAAVPLDAPRTAGPGRAGRRQDRPVPQPR